MAVAVKLKVEGVEDVVKALRAIEPKLQKKILRKVIGEASKVVLKAAKANVPKGTGQLKKSLGRRIKAYRRTHAVVGIIGPRSGFKDPTTGRNPTKYAHLVEFGRSVVRLKKAKLLSDGTTVYGKTVAAVAPRPFMRPALDNTRAQVQSIIRQGILEGIERGAGTK